MNYDKHLSDMSIGRSYYENTPVAWAIHLPLVCNTAIFFNRPNIAGAVLQSPSLLNNWWGQWSFSQNIFQTHSVSNWKSQGAEILRECLSHTLCQVSPVTCHIKKKILTKIRQIGGACRWRDCYQRGIPRLVFPENPITAFSLIHWFCYHCTQ